MEWFYGSAVAWFKRILLNPLETKITRSRWTRYKITRGVIMPHSLDDCFCTQHNNFHQRPMAIDCGIALWKHNFAYWFWKKVSDKPISSVCLEANGLWCILCLALKHYQSLPSIYHEDVCRDDNGQIIFSQCFVKHQTFSAWTIGTQNTYTMLFLAALLHLHKQRFDKWLCGGLMTQSNMQPYYI